VAPNTAIAFRFIPPGCYLREFGTIRMVRGRGRFPFYRRDTLSRGFWMAETETSQNEWLVVMADNPSYHQGCLDCPVESISWLDAVRFANGVSLREGMAPCYTLNGSDVEFAGLDCPGFRLPTHSEWKYAFRGAEGRRFPWGDEDPTPARANYGGTHGDTAPVRLFSDDRTPFEVYGMAANVSEWVNDWRETDPGPREDQVDPMGPSSGQLRQWVGTDFLQDAVYVEMAGGGAMLPTLSQPNLGVRLVRTWQGPE
jgi:formylglycine-generating enzyme required for sulfatase activity